MFHRLSVPMLLLCGVLRVWAVDPFLPDPQINVLNVGGAVEAVAHVSSDRKYVTLNARPQQSRLQGVFLEEVRAFSVMGIRPLDDDPRHLLNGIWEGTLQVAESDPGSSGEPVSLRVGSTDVRGTIGRELDRMCIVRSDAGGYRLALGWLEREEPLRKTALGKEVGGPVYGWAGLSVSYSNGYGTLSGTFRYQGRDHAIELTRKQPTLPEDVRRSFRAEVLNTRLKQEHPDTVVVDLTGERPTVHLPWVRTGGATLLGWNGQQRQFSIACDLLDRRGRVETVIILDGIMNSAGDAMTFYLGARQLGRGRLLLKAD